MAIDVTRFVARFVEEARDHLQRLNDGLTGLEAGEQEVIHAIFRSAHTIKGSARMLKLMTISETAHRIEDLLGALREGKVAFGPELGELLHRGVDALAGLTDQVAASPANPLLPAADAALCDALTRACQSEATPPPRPEPPPPVPTATRQPTAETVRVRLALLDELIKLTGELMSSHARLRHRLTELHAMDLSMNTNTDAVTVAQPLHQFFRHLREDVAAQALLMDALHDRTLQMRMLPLAIVLEPAARQVRELARSLGKQVECRIQGAGIELDRQMIDKLADPIVHLVRNAIDHGLELPEARLAVGKPAQGRLLLSARQDGRWAVIEIADDGRGIVLEEVRAQAARKGLLDADRAAVLNEQETIDLLFLPGFSTSGQISELSGRGVGLDVVRQTVLDELQGTIVVETRPGAGTTFTLRMPLSLAMMRVVLVEADGLPCAIGAGYIVELIRLPEAALESVAGGHAVVIRNELVAVTPLAELLRVPERLKRPGPHEAEGMLLMVLRARERKMAVRIDRLLDESNMVIHPVPEAMRPFPLVSGLVIDD